MKIQHIIVLLVILDLGSTVQQIRYAPVLQPMARTSAVISRVPISQARVEYRNYVNHDPRIIHRSHNSIPNLYKSVVTSRVQQDILRNAGTQVVRYNVPGFRTIYRTGHISQPTLGNQPVLNNSVPNVKITFEETQTSNCLQCRCISQLTLNVRCITCCSVNNSIPRTAAVRHAVHHQCVSCRPRAATRAAETRQRVIQYRVQHRLPNYRICRYYRVLSGNRTRRSAVRQAWTTNCHPRY